MCRCIGYGPVPLNNEQRFKFVMSTYTRAASLWDQRWTCETKEWNDRREVKRAVNQYQNEPKPTNQSDQPPNHRHHQQQQQPKKL